MVDSSDNVHLDLATRLVTSLQLSSESSDTPVISKEVTEAVLKPLLEKYIPKFFRIKHELPDSWFK
jgi:hypothetical protein